MYIRQIQFVREKFGVFSLAFANEFFRIPELYLMPTLADFNKHKDEFVMTGKKYFSPGKDFCSDSLLYFPSARYRKTRDVDCELVGKEIEREIKESIRNMPEPTCKKDVEIAVQKATEILRKGSERLNNGVLYDGSGCELAIYSEREFSNGTYLIKPLIRYQKSTEKLSLYCTGKSNIPSKEANPSLLESILNISPNFA